MYTVNPHAFWKQAKRWSRVGRRDVIKTNINNRVLLYIRKVLHLVPVM